MTTVLKAGHFLWRGAVSEEGGGAEPNCKILQTIFFAKTSNSYRLCAWCNRHGTEDGFVNPGGVYSMKYIILTTHPVA